MSTPPPLRELELAIAHGDLAAMEALLDADPALLEARFPENLDLTPLLWACRNRHATLVEALLERGASASATNRHEANGDGGNTALWFTAQGPWPGGVPIARLLLERGAVIDTPGERGTTALYMAAAWVHMDLVQFLLAHGADSRPKDTAGRTPIDAVRAHHARLQDQTERTPEMTRFFLRAPRMIAFLEKIDSQKNR